MKRFISQVQGLILKRQNGSITIIFRKDQIIRLAIEYRDFLRARGFHIDIIDLEKLVALVKERVNFVKEIWAETDFFFKAPESYDNEVVRKRWKEDSPSILRELRSLLEKVDDFSPSVTESLVKDWIEE